MKRCAVVLLTFLTLANATLAVANNLAAFEMLAHGRWKKLKHQRIEEFLNKFGTPTKTRAENKDGKIIDTLFYTEPGCRYRFIFEDKVFKKAVRNCM